MSAIIKTNTPFIDKEILLQALDSINCKYKYQVVGNEIITERTDYFGKQKFIFTNGRYQFQHDRDRYVWGSVKNTPVTEFLKQVEEKYNSIYAEKLAELERIRQEQLAEQERIRLEQEMKRLEQERIAYIEQQKQTIIQKAQEQGYTIEEKKVNNKIKLILRRNTY